MLRLTCVSLVLIGLVLAGPRDVKSPPKVALTFDDLPAHAALPPGMSRVDVARSVIATLQVEGRDWHWFHFPYLHEGDTPEKRTSVARFLADHGYRVAEVTMSFDDWAYNDPYARCAAKNDLAAIERMKQSYLRRAAQSVSAAQEAARLVYGHDIAHVMRVCCLARRRPPTIRWPGSRACAAEG